MPKTEAFDKHSDLYDEWFEKHAEFYRQELAAVHRLIPSPTANGMEVGVGTGKFAVPLNIKTGVEPSDKMAAKAAEQGIQVYSGVAENLPFENECFDFVLMVTTVCFVDDVLKSFQEISRVLVQGGCVIVGFVDKESDMGRRYLKKKEKSKFYKDATFFSTPEIIQFLTAAGFTVTETVQTLIPGEPEAILEGFGKGSFVVIKGEKS